jgi:hypothetical protein
LILNEIGVAARHSVQGGLRDNDLVPRRPALGEYLLPLAPLGEEIAGAVGVAGDLVLTEQVPVRLKARRQPLAGQSEDFLGPQLEVPKLEELRVEPRIPLHVGGRRGAQRLNGRSQVIGRFVELDQQFQLVRRGSDEALLDAADPGLASLHMLGDFALLAAGCLPGSPQGITSPLVTLCYPAHGWCPCLRLMVSTSDPRQYLRAAVSTLTRHGRVGVWQFRVTGSRSLSVV